MPQTEDIKQLFLYKPYVQVIKMKKLHAVNIGIYFQQVTKLGHFPALSGQMSKLSDLTWTQYLAYFLKSGGLRKEPISINLLETKPYIEMDFVTVNFQRLTIFDQKTAIPAQNMTKIDHF